MERPGAGAELSGHVVICNCNPQVRGVVEQFHAAQVGGCEVFDVLLLVQDEQLWLRNPGWHPRSGGPGRFIVRTGSANQIEHLGAVHMQKARAAIILADPHQGRLADARGALLAIAIERHAPQVHTVMELLLSVNRAHLTATDINEVVCLGDLTEKLLAQSAVTPGSTRLFAHLLSTDDHTAQVLLPRVPARLAGLTYRALARKAIVESAPLTVIGFARHERPQPDSSSSDPEELGDPGKLKLVLNPRTGEEPGKDTVLTPLDQLVIFAYAPDALSAL